MENFEQKDLMSLLSGNLKMEGLDYQFLGNKFVALFNKPLDISL